MHRLKSNWGRSLPVIAIALAAAATLAIVVAMNLGSGTSSVTASNLTPTPPFSSSALQKFTGVNCADLYLETNAGALTPLGSPPDTSGNPPNDLLVAAALTRTEPSATAGLLDVTTVVYQGPDLITGDEDVIRDVVPDQGPMAQLPTPQTCNTTRTAGQTGKEQNLMNQRTAFTNQFGIRPSAHASVIIGVYDPTNSEDSAASACGDGVDNGPDGKMDFMDPDCYDTGSTTYIIFSSCTFSEVLSVWERTDSINVITDKSAKAINYGRTTLYVATAKPTSGTVPGEDNEALDPTTCAYAGSLPFANVTVVHARTATTDHPELPANATAMAAGKLQVDADGCNPVYGNVTQKPTPAATWPPTPTQSPTPPPTPTPAANCNPKPKDGQDPDGANEQSTGGYKADDWDGDGCPDWDELDHQFTHSFTAPNSANQNGIDPFNPNDCNKNFNGNMGLFVTMKHDDSTTGACNLGQLLTEGSGPGSCSPSGTGAHIPNGQYFLCRTDVTHTKGVDADLGTTGLQEAISLTAGCYGDSTTQVVNPSYFAEKGADCTNNTDDDGDGFINDGCPKVGSFNDNAAVASECDAGNNTDAPDEDPMPGIQNDDSVVNDGCPAKPDTCPGAAPVTQDDCGDGRAGGRPPGGALRNSGQSFLAIGDATSPLLFSGVYDHQDNRLKFDTCFVGTGRSFFGPSVGNDNVKAHFSIDAHTGAGTVDLSGGLTAPDCSGTPTITIPPKEVLMVELGQNVDSDHDGCTDSQELGSDVTLGGKRDVFNKWDYFNPLLNDINRTGDITAVVNKYGQDDDGMHPPYRQRYDRGGSVPGSNKWNFLPPDGIIRTGDITAAVNSYGHDCLPKVPPPYTS